MNLPMWGFIPHSNYLEALAKDPEPEIGVLQQLWDHFFSGTTVVTKSEVEFVSPDLQSAPMRLLDWVAPPPNWREACSKQNGVPELGNAGLSAHKIVAHGDSSDMVAAADGVDSSVLELSAGGQVSMQLSHTFDRWQSTRTQGPGIQLILAAPHSGVTAMVNGWAQQRGYLMPPLPSSAQVQDPNNDWLDGLKEQIANVPEAEQHKIRVVITGLEHFFLRHHNGLNFLRSVMDYLATAGPPSLVVCNSWAWAYLRDALHLDAMVQSPFTLERASDKMLKAWLTELSSGSHHRTFTFRQGEQILCTVGGRAGDDTIAEINEVNDEAFTQFCSRLAEISRGNPGVARAIWRQSVNIEAAVNIEAQIQREAQDDPGYTIWVQPVDESVLPVVPTTFTNNDAFILHTLLIQNGLSRILLEQALPLSVSLISRRLQVMLNAGLVRNSDNLERDSRTRNELLRDDIIDVSPLGYIPVRNFLREQGFFVDTL